MNPGWLKPTSSCWPSKPAESPASPAPYPAVISKRWAVARWLATKPKLIILDEPTQGVDVGAKSEIYKLISELAQQGLAILMISSDLPEVFGMSDRIVGHARGNGGRLNGSRCRHAGTGAGIGPRTRGGCMLKIADHRREISVAGVYVALLAVLAVMRPVYFHVQFFSGLVQSAPLLIAAVGMTWVILARQIDISIGSQFSVCGVVAAMAARVGLPMPLVAALAIFTGGVFGALNGFLVGFIELPSIVVTLATMVLLKQGLSWIRNGVAVNGLPPAFQWFGASQSVGEIFIVIVASAVFFIFLYASNYLTGGRAVYAVGSDHEAARLAGLRPRHVTFVVFTLMGALAGLAALLNAVRFPQADTKAGDGLNCR